FALSLLIYSGIYVAVVTLSLPVAALMTLAGGFLFGQEFGTVSAVISATLGASLLFLGTKMASHDVLSSKEGTWVKTMKKGFQDNAFFYLLTLRLIPIFPFVAVNLVAALLQIPLRTFFLGTLIGIIPGSFVYVSLGVALREVIHQPSPNLIVSPKILIAFAGLGILSLLPVLYKWYHPNSLDKNQDPQNQ
ncbi:MAG: VTT domain-containing protein, partial [Alphaproteobacteria bacterium]|nr:VTT domain-containing protein [Alphaproteobacteria bacterium]